MTLLMYLGNDLIEAVPVCLDKLSEPGYLGSFKRMLKQKHQLLLQQSAVPPEFLVFDLNPVQKQCTETASYVSANTSALLEVTVAQAPAY